jgi:hypothetical protein
MEKITKTFTITCKPYLMKRFENLLSMLHLYCSWGHSTMVAMFIDGDGSDDFKIDGFNVTKIPRNDIDLISGVGTDIEIAGENQFDGINIDKTPKNFWYAKNGTLYKNGKAYKNEFGLLGE